MWKILPVVVVAMLLSGCTDVVYLRHKTSGDVVKCGPYYTGVGGDFKMDGIAARESQCISDYQRQGYERTPAP